MGNTYVIVGKDDYNTVVYAEVDSTYPMWDKDLHNAKRFYTLDNAKKWFDECKGFLIHEKFSRYDVDISTVYIAQIHTILEKVEDMVSIKKDVSIIISCNTIDGNTLYATGRERHPWATMETDAILFKSEKEAEQWYHQNHNSLFDNPGYHIHTDSIIITTTTVKKLGYKNEEE